MVIMVGILNKYQEYYTLFWSGLELKKKRNLESIIIYVFEAQQLLLFHYK